MGNPLSNPNPSPGVHIINYPENNEEGICSIGFSNLGFYCRFEWRPTHPGIDIRTIDIVIDEAAFAFVKDEETRNNNINIVEYFEKQIFKELKAIDKANEEGHFYDEIPEDEFNDPEVVD